MQYRCGLCGARDNGSDGRRADVGLDCSPGEVPAGSQVPVSRSSPLQRCAPEPLLAPLFAPLLMARRRKEVSFYFDDSIVIFLFFFFLKFFTYTIGQISILREDIFKFSRERIIIEVTHV